MRRIEFVGFAQCIICNRALQTQFSYAINEEPGQCSSNYQISKTRTYEIYALH